MQLLWDQFAAWSAVLRPWAWLFVPLSAALLLLSLAVLPWVLVQLPVDYLVNPRAHIQVGRTDHPTARRVLAVFQTLLGALLLAAGLAMLVLPGQGVLAVLAGLLLLRFPGKRQVVRALLSRRGLLRAVDALRGRFGHDPLIRPGERRPPS